MDSYRRVILRNVFGSGSGQFKDQQRQKCPAVFQYALTFRNLASHI